MTQYVISKRAGPIDEAAIGWLRTVFDVSAGPFENTFKLISFAAPFMGLGIWKFLVISFATKALGLSPAQFGRKIDDIIGMKPGDKIDTGLMPMFEKAINGMLSKRANTGIDLYKEAGLVSTLLKSGGAAKWLWKAVQKLMFVLSGVFGIASIDKLYDMFAEPISETIKETVSPETGKLPLSYREEGVPKIDSKNEIDRMIDKLKKKYNLA